MKLSIITINLNNRDGLERTLNSVQAQTFRNFEQIVIDGGSSDGSLDVIQGRAETITYWVSEPDAGIYFAMNKGIKISSGEYLIFLNSGDCLASTDVLANIFCDENPESDIIYGDTLRKTPDGSTELRATPENLTPFAFYKFRICHQSVIYRRTLFEKYGDYDISFRISADTEFNLRCLRAGAKARRVQFPISIYEGGGVSATNIENATAENERIWNHYLEPSIREDYERLAYLDAECRRLQMAEDWIENAKRKPLWFNIALVCKWQWDKLVQKKRFFPDGRATLRSAFWRFPRRFLRNAKRDRQVSGSTRPVVHLYATCLNEARMIPYFLKHYESFVDVFTIFDNCSTDESVKMLKVHPKVRVVSFDSGGKFDESAILWIKNQAWKASRGLADFVIVCDMDEFLYHPDPESLLKLLRDREYTLLHTNGYEMASEQLPEFSGTSITTLVTKGVPDSKHYSKTLLFDPDKLTEINFNAGCHKSYPAGTVKAYQSKDVKLLHCKYVDRDEVLRKYRWNRGRMSANNVKNNLSKHNMRSDEEVMATFDRILTQAETVI